MIFNSLTFFVFLAIVIPLYWQLPRTPRLLLLLLASAIFYGFWRFDFLALLFASITFDYFSGLIIAGAASPARRKLFLAASVTINLSVLVFFKYFYFLADSFAGLGHLLGVEVSRPTWNIILPIGVSFYTFHAMSYIIDVYRGHIKPVRSYLLFCNYVIFFPQLVAGPILRAGEMVWQLDKRPDFDWAVIADGFARIAAGLFLKVVLADNIAAYVNEAYAADPARLFPIDTLTLGFLFGFQIYFDFAGYSHIAIGVALLMGIRFPENFHYPYLSQSPRVFWRRWHISLSSWIRHYVYLPLAGVKVADRMSTGGIGIDGTGQIGRNSALLALFATWAIMGLWHGAAWTFVVWGLWHAALVQGHRWLSPLAASIKGRALSVIGWAVTLALVMIGWVPFRAPSLDYTFKVWSNLFNLAHPLGRGLRESTYVVAAFGLLLVVVAPFAERLARTVRTRYPVLATPAALAIWSLMLMLIIVYLRPISQFIYFQF
ncbi:MAG: MBOAT family protein [Sandarakinorhabdus sp.]|nr:MBOAT family protein [Sandarakinorhabdus sp.]